MEYTDEQLKVIYTEQPKVLVKSGAGSGKTAVLVARIQYLLQSGVSPQDIVAITFTNLAAEEMAKRLGHPQGLMVSTIHSYANYLLRSSGIDTSACLNEENFDLLFEMVCDHPDCTKPVKYLLVDEGHDLSTIQFNFIFNYIKPAQWMIFYDYRQCIYEWRDADPNYLMRLEDVYPIMELSQNFRCGTSILDYARTKLWSLPASYQDHSRAARKEKGIRAEVQTTSESLAKYIATAGRPWKDWFVLTRSNAQLESFTATLDKLGIPNTTFKQGDMTLEELEDAMGRDSVVVLTIHSSKGLERPCVAVMGARQGGWVNNEEHRLNYVACTRARDMLLWVGTPKKSKVESWE